MRIMQGQTAQSCKSLDSPADAPSPAPSPERKAAKASCRMSPAPHRPAIRLKSPPRPAVAAMGGKG